MNFQITHFRLILTAIIATGQSAAALGADVQPISITPDSFNIPPGKPLSVRSLVTHPAPLQGVASWTIESRRHRGHISALAVHPEGKLAVTGGIDGTIRMWDLTTGQLVRAMVGHDSYIYSLDWSPDGNTIASAGTWDGTVRVWDARNGMPLRVFKGHVAPVMHVAWSPSGDRLAASGGHSGWVWMWTVQNNHDEKLVEVGVDTYSLAWSPNGEQLVICMTMNPVKIFDLSLQKTVQSIGEPSGIFYTGHYSPDGTKLALGTAGQTMIWEPTEPKLERQMTGTAYSAAWSPDGKILASAGAGGQVLLWEAASGKRDKLLAGSVATGMRWVKPDLLVLRSYTGLSVWNPTTGKLLYEYTLAATAPPVWTPGRPFVLGIGTNKVSLWDSLTAKMLRSFEGHTAAINAVSWTRDSKTLATASNDQTVCMWDASGGKLLRTLRDHTAPVTCVSWSPDGKILASAGNDPTVRLWHISGKSEGVFSGHAKGVNELAWTPRGNILAVGGADASVKLWTVDRGQVQRELNAFQPVQSLAWNPDGSLLAGGTTDQLVRIWQTSNGQLVGNLRQGGSPPSVTALAWSPDGTVLLSGRGNHTVQLWDPKVDTKPLHDLQAMAPVQYVGWGTGGSMLVAGNADRTVRFWDAGNAELRGVALAESDHLVIIGTDGHYRMDTSKTPELFYVVQTASEQLTLKPAEFATKFRWRNVPAQVKVTGK